MTTRTQSGTIAALLPPSVAGHTTRISDLPLGFLPAFEAAGRLGSFAAAAAELHVTPSAISQQIRALEDALGVSLFARTRRSAELTDAGRKYLTEVRQALNALAASTERLRRGRSGSVLRLTTMAIVAQEFLLPRLSQFRARFPAIELRIETTNELVDFAISDHDAAIRVGNTWPGLTVRTLGQVTFALVCSPQLAAAIHTPHDLAGQTLLDPCGEGSSLFTSLLAQCGYPTRLAGVWRFETCHETLMAAEHGMGVTFAAFPIASPWIAQRKLAVPFAQRVAMPGALSLAHRADDTQRLPFAEIAEWLKAEYTALPPLPNGRVLCA
jgi:LysR family glycine cleavage system transcriptional activator